MAIDRSGQLHIVDIAAAAAQQPRILEPHDGLPK